MGIIHISVVIHRFHWASDLLGLEGTMQNLKASIKLPVLLILCLLIQPSSSILRALYKSQAHTKHQNNTCSREDIDAEVKKTPVNLRNVSTVSSRKPSGR